MPPHHSEQAIAAVQFIIR